MNHKNTRYFVRIYMLQRCACPKVIFSALNIQFVFILRIIMKIWDIIIEDNDILCGCALNECRVRVPHSENTRNRLKNVATKARKCDCEWNPSAPITFRPLVARRVLILKRVCECADDLKRGPHDNKNMNAKLCARHDDNSSRK